MGVRKEDCGDFQEDGGVVNSREIASLRIVVHMLEHSNMSKRRRREVGSHIHQGSEGRTEAHGESRDTSAKKKVTEPQLVAWERRLKPVDTQ